MSKLQSLRSNRILQALGWVSVPFFPLFCAFVMDYMNYQGHLVRLMPFWEKHPKSALFEAVVVLILFGVLTLLIGRVWISAAVFGGVSLICAYVNFTKFSLNSDYFYPQDIAMLQDAKGLASFISGALPGWFFVGAAAIVLWAVYLWFVKTAVPGHWAIRCTAAVVIGAVVYTSVNTTTKAEKMLNRFGMSTFDAALQSSNYTANGFVGAFTVNLLSLQVRPPEGYEAQAVEALLAPYEAVPADEAAPLYDVVVVLSESFFDPRTLPGVTFSESPLTNYDRILKEEGCVSGMLYTTALGGGTVRPEFGILTGLTTDYMPDVATPYWYVDQPFPTYVTHYKDAGYKAIALHPYDKKFYARESAYPLLGFDEFYGEQDMYERTEVIGKRGYVADETTAEVMMDLVEAQDQPTFLFTITMQNHQPYKALPEEDIRIQVEAPALSESAHTALTTYTQGLYDADKMLGTLVDWIDNRARPTVLVFFGDHLPTLGANFLAYQETGFVNLADGRDSEESQKLYSTPFLIYSNQTLEPGLLPQKEGNVLSDYNLLNTVLRSTGMARTPYMELLADFYQVTPYYNVRLGLPKTEAIVPFTTAMEMLTYDRVMGRGWSK